MSKIPCSFKARHTFKDLLNKKYVCVVLKKNLRKEDTYDFKRYFENRRT